MRWKATVVVAALAVAVLAGAARCEHPAGTVTDHDKDCKQTRQDTSVCTYQIKTTEWFEVTRIIYETCRIGDTYPDCARSH